MGVTMSADLELKVLAHEQILQAMIAYIGETGPGLADYLAATFGVSTGIDESHQDRVDVATHAARLVRAVIDAGASNSRTKVVLPAGDLPPERGQMNIVNENLLVRLEIHHAAELWEITRNGRLIGGYVSRLGAMEVALAAVNEIVGHGGSVELIAIAPRGES